MKWNFSCSALLHTKTIVSLKYFVNDCSWFWYLYMSAKNVRHFWNNSYSGIFFEVSFRGVQNELNLPNSLKFFVYFLQINSTISLLHEKKKKKKKKKNAREKHLSGNHQLHYMLKEWIFWVEKGNLQSTACNLRDSEISLCKAAFTLIYILIYK